jgi:hypothetical protein
VGRSKGQTSGQVSKGEERAKRAYGIEKWWRPCGRPRRTGENIAKFFGCAISSAGYRGGATDQIQFSRSRKSCAKQPRGGSKSAQHTSCKCQNNSGGSQPRGD